MQFRRILTTAALSATLSSLSTGAPAIECVPAFPNLTIAKPVTTAIIPGTDRELILAQGGVIYELPKDREASEAAIWFDLTSRVQIDKDFEEGLLGIAFHPKFESNKKVSNEAIRERNGAATKKGQAFQPTHFTQRPDGEIWALSWDGRIYEMVKG